jgi:splicing factor 3B subunit 4
MIERNQDATVYVGNLDGKVDEEILWELFVQCGPLASVTLPRDRITQNHQGYAFVEFKSTEDCDYSIRIQNMMKLYGKPIRCNKSANVSSMGTPGSGGTVGGANLFIGSLSPDVDEGTLSDCFSQFGSVASVRIQRDPETGISRGFGFITFDSFDSADKAIGAMNGQYLGNRPITVSYAHKKDNNQQNTPDTHGSAAERFITELRLKQTNHPAGLLPPPPPIPSSLR